MARAAGYEPRTWTPIISPPQEVVSPPRALLGGGRSFKGASQLFSQLRSQLSWHSRRGLDPASGSLLELPPQVTKSESYQGCYLAEAF